MTADRREAGSFVVSNRPFLVAVGNGVLLTVDRSSVVSTDSEEYRPIREYIEDNGMTLLERKVGPCDRMYGSRVFQEWYAVPDARNLLLTEFEENE